MRAHGPSFTLVIRHSLPTFKSFSAEYKHKSTSSVASSVCAQSLVFSLTVSNVFVPYRNLSVPPRYHTLAIEGLTARYHPLPHFCLTHSPTSNTSNANFWSTIPDNYFMMLILYDHCVLMVRIASELSKRMPSSYRNEERIPLRKR